jgi:hypothetical protein
MVRFKQRLDSSWKIYIPKILREAGFDSEITIAPNTRACVMFPSSVPLDQVLDSLRIIEQDLQNSIKLARVSGEAEDNVRPTARRSTLREVANTPNSGGKARE